jgi:hypothetical protein
MSTGTTDTDDATKRRDDEQAREEIRELFARYRRIARHGVVSEDDARRPPQADPPVAGRPSTSE